MGLSPTLWGKEGWRFIHFVAVTYQPSKKEEYLQFFQNLPEILPCPVCGNHFRENMEANPPDMENSKTLFNWTVDMHNYVNILKGKRVYTYERAYNDLFQKKYQMSDFSNGLLLSTATAGLLMILMKGIIKK